MTAPPRVPRDPDLYADVVDEAKTRFAVWPSAYASGWVVKTYKERGGKYAGQVRGQDTGLTKWFGEEWVDLSRPTPDGGYEPCGRKSSDDPADYPKCRPLAEALRMSPDEVADAVRRKRRAERQAEPVEGRSRAPVMVPTYREDEDMRRNPAVRRTPQPRARAEDMLDAIQQADAYGDQGWTLDDFNILPMGEVPLSRVLGYEDCAWIDVRPEDFAGMSVEDRLDELSSFRGPKWSARAAEWLSEGVPPIVVIDAPVVDEAHLYRQIGDGRGRVNFALAMGLKTLPVVIMKWKHPLPQQNPTSRRNPTTSSETQGELWHIRK